MGVKIGGPWYADIRSITPRTPDQEKCVGRELSDPKPPERPSYNWYAEAHIKVVLSFIDLDRRSPSTIYLIYTCLDIVIK